MGKWIDADALIESIKNTADLGGWIGEALYQIKQVAIKYIDSAPSIDIVRCKECKWQSVITDEEEGTYYMCGIWTMPTDEDVFCSHGVRKTNTTAEEKPTPIRDYMVHGEREGE